MARATKKKAKLTPEENLAQALVPEAEQPYKVPENWYWTRLRNLLITSKEKTEDFSDQSVKYIGLENMEKDGGIASYGSAANVKSTKNVFHEGQILYGRLRPYLNKHDIVDSSGVCSTDILVFDTRLDISNKFVNYYLSLQSFIEYAVANSKGINLPRVSETIVLSAKCPLPPLPEQQRIVDRIESLFAKLDEAKEKAQAVVDGFEDRKAAILHKAFTGELTAEWRKRNGIPSATWKEVSLDSVCNSIYDGDHMPPPKSDEGIPFLVISNVNTGYLSYTGTRFVPQEYYDGLTETRKPERGDVLYTLVGSYGIPVVIDDDRPFCFQRHMALLKPSLINTYFLWFQLQSKEFYNKASEIATGTAQLTVPIKGLRKLTVHLPSETEQIEVVRILDKLIGGEQQAKGASEQVIAQIGTMKKSILARAFRGEMGTNDPAEESAVELLKRML